MLVRHSHNASLYFYSNNQTYCRADPTDPQNNNNNIKMPAPAEQPPTKGAAIKFVGGTYQGLYGWLNRDRQCSTCFVYVIVALKAGKEKCTKVRHENYVLRTAIRNPTNYEEAAVQQHADIDAMLRRLAKSLAECEEILPEGDSGKRISNIFLEYLQQAVATQASKPVEKQRWRRVRFRCNNNN